MRILTLYFLKQITLGFCLLTTSLIMVVWLTQSLRFIDSIIGKGLPLSLFLQVTFALIPFFFVVICPLSAFIAVLFVYNRMNSDREIIVLKAAGMTYFQMIKAPLILGALLTGLCFYFTLIVIPESYQTFRELQWKIKNDLSHVMIRAGEFNTISPKITLYVKEKSPEGNLSEIMMNDTSNPEKKVTFLAKRGQLLLTGLSPKVVMEEGSRQEANQRTGEFSILYFDQYVMDFSFFSKIPAARRANLSELSVVELNEEIKKEENPLLVSKMKVEIHERFTQPLYTLCFALIAALGLIYGTFNRRGSALRVIVMVALLLLFESLSLIVKNLAIRSSVLIVLMYVVPLFPLGVVFVLIRSPEFFGRFVRRLIPPRREIAE